MKEALLYNKLPDGSVKCLLCVQQCHIAEGQSGLCRVRQNQRGKLYSLSYGRIIAANVDPVEKKPLFHFLPGSSSFSIAAFGCNFRCGFCQNWEISQIAHPAQESEPVSVEEIVNAALKNKCKSISYTYTEPTVFLEYALEIATLAKEKGLYNIFVTNGYMSSACLRLLAGCLDAANVDLKFFREESYRRLCGASLTPVLDSIRLMHQLGLWVEVTTLVIPGENDSEEELSAVAGFLADVDHNIPWHVSRFYPAYKFNSYPPTPEEKLHTAVSIGRAAGLNFVYAGNVSGWAEDTLCPVCKRSLIKREIFRVLEYNIKEGRCPYCKEAIAGVFKDD
jgi:pyruvate formate lyase activating enzyme